MTPRKATKLGTKLKHQTTTEIRPSRTYGMDNLSTSKVPIRRSMLIEKVSSETDRYKPIKTALNLII